MRWYYLKCGFQLPKWFLLLMFLSQEKLAKRVNFVTDVIMGSRDRKN